ncbi:MAG TPA: CheR family methyltransferase [Actinomycetospora sp.]|uniref:CheR family methyltransferase n=1 Tax=Actinomycetospora sp. TaxID=1872135 RepID=UPI002F3F5A4E
MTEEVDSEFESLLEFIKESRGFDFTGYKRSSIQRRVERRMQQVEVTGYAEYLDRLQVDQNEFTQLFNTILINVTGFFRDPEAWRELQQEVTPALLAPKTRGESIRVWSAGCASGEEAYTLAILLAEVIGVEEFRRRVKVYATDVDEDALATARQATYGEKEMQAVPEDLRERYFERTGSRYVFRSDLRQSVIFGRNDLVQDAPIGRLDLLVCRNTLMYLNAETQAQVLRRFHFALNPAGVLFLGRAEMLLSHARLFLPIDLKRRFFRKAEQVEAGPRPGGASSQPDGERTGRDPRLEDEALLLSPLATLVVNPHEIVVKANQRAEAQLGVSSREIGRAFPDLDLCQRIGGLRTAFDDVRRSRSPIWLHEAQFSRSATEMLFFDIQLAPLEVGADGGIAVAVFFSDVTRYQRMTGELQAAHRQVETAYEELQSTVEELETTNEELQSTVEELETTNEELQSTNDELQSMNDELRERTSQLDEANDFLESVLGSLRTAVVVVDTDLIVRAWNGQAEDLWGLRAEETIGQHLLNLDVDLPMERVRPLVRAALSGDAEQAPLRLEVINRRGRTVGLVLSASPLRLRGSVPTGAIVLMDQSEAGVPASSS